MSLKLKSKKAVWGFIHLHRRNPLVARFSRLCKNIYRASEHSNNFDVKTNGERSVLHRCLQKPGGIVFDVGANLGEWTMMAHELGNASKIVSFEMNPPVAQQLQNACAGKQEIHVEPIALSNREGFAKCFAYEGEASVLSSLRSKLYVKHAPVEISVKVKTGDHFCDIENIQSIDFLKIDAEGHDFEVLEGFAGMLKRNQVFAIQFEHEGGRYIKDFYDLLEPCGYKIGKLYANYVDFREHEIKLEQFLGPNYIAIPQSRGELIRELKIGW